jgi:epoxide hydrolase 4
MDLQTGYLRKEPAGRLILGTESQPHESPGLVISPADLLVRGRRWRYLESGDAGAPVVVLLHGFPECRESWHLQMSELADGGWHVYAPDLPGFGGTQAPPSYDLATLAHVTASFLDHVSEGTGAHLVGHDWGGIVAHAVAANHSASVRSLAALCAPHPATLATAARSPAQVLRSYYVGLFQIPGIERVFGASEGHLARKLFPGASSEMDNVDSVRNGLSYYRANMRPWKLSRVKVGRIRQPGLVVHATRDRYIGAPLMRQTIREFDNLIAYREIDAPHFVHREKPAVVNELLKDFFEEASTSR